MLEALLDHHEVVHEALQEVHHEVVVLEVADQEVVLNLQVALLEEEKTKQYSIFLKYFRIKRTGEFCKKNSPISLP